MASSDGWRWRTFWDLHDSAQAQATEALDTAYPPGGSTAVTFPDFDQVDGNQGGSTDPKDHVIMDVLTGYLGGNLLPTNPAYSDRGMSDKDLVDVLDGMMCRGHMTEEQATQMLRGMMDYDYDFTPLDDPC